jgi:hypothetical protein
MENISWQESFRSNLIIHCKAEMMENSKTEISVNSFVGEPRIKVKKYLKRLIEKHLVGNGCKLIEALSTLYFEALSISRRKNGQT